MPQAKDIMKGQQIIRHLICFYCIFLPPKRRKSASGMFCLIYQSILTGLGTQQLNYEEGREHPQR